MTADERRQKLSDAYRYAEQLEDAGQHDRAAIVRANIYYFEQSQGQHSRAIGDPADLLRPAKTTENNP